MSQIFSVFFVSLVVTLPALNGFVNPSAQRQLCNRHPTPCPPRLLAQPGGKHSRARPQEAAQAGAWYSMFRRPRNPTNDRLMFAGLSEAEDRWLTEPTLRRRGEQQVRRNKQCQEKPWQSDLLPLDHH